MAIQGAADNNQSAIMRAGNVVNSNVTAVSVGENVQRITSGPTGSVQGYPQDGNESAIVGNMNAAAGNVTEVIKAAETNQRKSRANETFQWERRQAASGYDIHGQPIEAITETSVTFADDETADDGRGSDNGEWGFNRAGTVQATGYPALTA